MSVYELDLGELDIDDGPSLARLVTRIRELMREHGKVRIFDCPQLLAHTLYKAGELRHGGLELVSVREEEPYG